ncbi:threonine ammonia-lyase IlvA [Granulicoccus phenolivorans]|uniref:threonine ammonia-lyase IlvA n=1 Tax=Granulicoccus phenolivorans TaxID=266854 RepID=UPI001FDF5D46|nr:threonine ammonia-lyase IlvA [Granulicoccus phenolivorans]
MTELTAADIDAAATNLADVVRRTPLQANARLSELAGGSVLIKREDLQPVRSYKLRGAYNMISQLSAEETRLGVVAASAGNHGQGVAYACARLKIKARIFVPTTTPRQKRDRMIKLGGEYITLVVTGETYDQASKAAKLDAAESGAVLVPAFDDPRVIAGQGTVAGEIVYQLGKAPDVLLVPVGGGGLLAGCLTWFRANYPATRVIGIEPAGAACLQAAITAGHPVELDDIDTFVDGAAVSRAGDEPYQLVAAHGVELISVPEGQVCHEMLDLYQVDGIIAEPAGALALAALGRQVRLNPGQTAVAILSGGNNDVSRYAEIVERALIWEGRKHYFLVSFPQEPGALRRFLDEVLGPDDDVTLFEYVKRDNREIGPALIGLELGNPAELRALMERMERSNLQAEKIDPNSPMYRFLI